MVPALCKLRASAVQQLLWRQLSPWKLIQPAGLVQICWRMCSANR